MLEEDLDKERFFAFTRRMFWDAAEGSATRALDADADREAGVLTTDPPASASYRDAGVDIDAGNETVRRIKSIARATFTPGVLSEIGSFGGLVPARSEPLPRAGAGVERRRRRAPSSRSRS